MGALTYVLIAMGMHGAMAAEVAPVDLALYVPHGNPQLAEPANVVVVTHRSGEAADDVVPTLEASPAEVVGDAERMGPGRWAFRVLATEAKPITLTARAGGVQIRRTIGPPSVASSRISGPPSLVAGVSDTVVFPLRDTRSPRATPDQIRVYVPEGSAEVIADPAGELEVRWTPGAAPFPRAVPIAVHDLRTPRIPPAWSVVRLHARPRVPIKTEPGAKVELRIGGRTYGPWVADDTGLVEARPEVRSGEAAATVVVQDALGNTQRSEVALGGDVRPGLGLVPSGAIVPGRQVPVLWVHGVSAMGQPWRGSAPECRTAAGQDLRLTRDGEATWRASLQGAVSTVDLRVHCTLGTHASLAVQVPVASEIPTRLVLRAHPERLTADLPVAEVQAFLENASGDRLPSKGIEIRAQYGDIELDSTEWRSGIRGVYQGQHAALNGSDTLTAGVNLPPGEGGVWSLDIAGAAPQGRAHIVIDGRALDRYGRPLADVSLALRSPGRSADVRTNSRGWASIELPWPSGQDVVVVEASAGGMVRRTAILPGDRVAAGPGMHDLRAELVIPIAAGRIRNMLLTAEPRVLESGGDWGKIIVRLEDGAGNAVPDQSVEIVATVGEVGPVTLRSNGSYEATYTPPEEVPTIAARITASSPDGRFSASTNLEIVPRRYQNATGVHIGYLIGPQRTASPYGVIDHDLRLPLPPFVVRVSAGYYQLVAEDFDSIAGAPVRMNLRALPLGLGLLARRDDTRVPTWIGAQLVVIPHRIETWLGGTQVATGVNVAPPGLRVLSGLGWRLRSGEIQAQVGYLFVYGTRTDIGWHGPVGGVVGTLGYKVLY